MITMPTPEKTERSLPGGVVGEGGGKEGGGGLVYLKPQPSPSRTQSMFLRGAVKKESLIKNEVV